MGRFATGDPYLASAGAGEPSSFNRYAYVGGDPANFSDANGLRRESAEGGVEYIRTYVPDYDWDGESMREYTVFETNRQVGRVSEPFLLSNTASSVLQSLVVGFLNGGGSEYGQIKIDPKLQGAQVSRRFGVAGTVTLTIGPSHLQGNVNDIGHTLLHELGHIYDLTRGSGGSQVQSPDALPDWIPGIGGDEKSRQNDWLIDQKCFGGTLGYKKP